MTIRQLDIAFKVTSGVRQGCVMSAVLLNFAIEWVMKKTIEEPPRRIIWTLFSSLEDIDFTDDAALLSHTRQDFQEETSKLNDISQKLGHPLEKENLDDPKNVEEDNRKSTGINTFELGSGCKASCRQNKIKDPCFCPMCQWARRGSSK